MPNAPAYCSTDDMIVDGNRWNNPLSNEEAARAALMASTASRMIDRLCGSWFYKRHLQVITQAPGDLTSQIFMPAELTGSLEEVVEDGVTLDLGNVVVYPSWLEKKVLGSFSSFNAPAAKDYWSHLQQAISFKGFFGPEAAPDDIIKLTAHLAATLMGWGTRSYTVGDGPERQVLNEDSFPDWAKAIIRDRSRSTWHGQVFILKDI